MIANRHGHREQTERRGGASSTDPGNANVGSIRAELSTIASDVSKLMELQRRLALLETQAIVRTIQPAFILFGVGAVMALTAFPLVLSALAEQLVVMTNLSIAGSQAIVGGAALLIGAVLIQRALGIVRMMPPPFERTSQQWHENLRWLHHTLGSSKS